MQLPIRNLSGEEVGQLELRPDVFGVPVKQAIVHQAVLRQLANRHQGTSSTKTRAEVEGSSIKLYRQKGTGRARAGNLRSPLRRHGGIIFGPHPRSYHQRLPKKMRRLALRYALSAKVEAGELVIVDKFGEDLVKTRQMAQALEALGVADSALVVTDKVEPGLVMAARNINAVKTLPADVLNVLDVIAHHYLVMSVAAVKRAEELWAAEPAESAAS